MDDDLGVGVRPEHVAHLEIRPERLVIVDFTIAREGDVAVLVQQGLASARDVDDRQAPVSQDDVSDGVETRPVRPPMVHPLGGCMDTGRVRYRANATTDYQSTHLSLRKKTKERAPIAGTGATLGV